MKLARPIATVGAATLASRLLGFLRDVMTAAIFGAGPYADALLVAFQIPNFARRLLAEGALNAAFVPLYLRRREEGGEKAAASFAGQVTASLLLILCAVAGLLALVMPIVVVMLAPGFGAEDPRASLAAGFARLMLPYLVIAGPIAVLSGVLNANHRFAAASLVAVVFNTVLISALLAILAFHPPSEQSGHLLAAAVGVAGFAQFALVGAAILMRGSGVSTLRPSFAPPIRRFLNLCIPGLVANGVPQLTLMVGMMVASMTPSAVSWLYYANRLIELPLGVVGIAIGTVLVPAFSHANRAADRAASVAAQSRGLELAVGLSFPAALGLAVLARPIVTILFEHGAFTSTDTIATASAVAVLALGLPGHVLVKACSPAFFAREDTSTPMRAALIGLAVAGLASLALFRVLGPLGIASAIALSGWAGAIALAFFLRRRIGFELDRAARRRLPLIVLASVAMAAGLIAALPLAAPFLAQARPLAVRGAMLGGLMAGGFVFYFGLLRLFGVLTFRQLVAAVNGEAQTPLA